MKGYGQFCPLAQATQVLCERWTLLIVRELLAGSTRFNEIHKGVPLMSPTLLSTRLKQLLKADIVMLEGNRNNYSYLLTEAGLELRPIVELMGAWGHRWVRSNLDKEDLDAGLLMWDMRRCVDPTQFSCDRVVVEFEYPDAPPGARRWWLISMEGEADLCLDDPGYEVDVLICSSLKTMTEIWICEKKFNDAVQQGEIEVSGDPQLVKTLQAWLCSSPLSRLGTLDHLPQLNW